MMARVFSTVSYTALGVSQLPVSVYLSWTQYLCGISPFLLGIHGLPGPCKVCTNALNERSVNTSSLNPVQYVPHPRCYYAAYKHSTTLSTDYTVCSPIRPHREKNTLLPCCGTQRSLTVI